MIIILFFLLISLSFIASSYSVSSANEPIWDGNKVELEAEKLGEGVYAVVPRGAKVKADKGIPIATTAGIVVGDNGVLVVESMLNKRLADQLIGLVRKITDKPIRYLVNTSYHGDHFYGNYVFPSSTVVIHHTNASA